MQSPTAPLNGRRAQAARNDQGILEAARAVFLADPAARIAAVAARAGVGISALYRRYRSKDDLLQRLCLDGLQRYITATEAALADHGDPWSAFARFMRRCPAEGTGALTLRFAGTFSASEELPRAGRTPHDATTPRTASLCVPRLPARCAPTLRSATSLCCASNARPSGSVTSSAPVSSGTAT